MLQMLIKGGWMMTPLALCSLVSVTIIIERLLFFSRPGRGHRAEDVLALVTEGQMDQAIGMMKESPKGSHSPVTNVLLAGIVNSPEPAAAMEAAGIREIALMKRGLRVLDTIITLSPLLGLLGTIIGMISAFDIISASGLGQPHAVTGGVAEALICTAAGIIVAVITLVPYNYFLSCIEQETGTIETYATRLELALSASSRGRQ